MFDSTGSTPQDTQEAPQQAQGSTLPTTPPPSGQRSSGHQRHVPAPSGKDYAPGPIRKEHDAEVALYQTRRNALIRSERSYEFLDDLPHDVAAQFVDTHRGVIEGAEREMLEEEGVDPEWQAGDDWDNGPRFSDDEGSY